jgi:hypothetical protein
MAWDVNAALTAAFADSVAAKWGGGEGAGDGAGDGNGNVRVAAVGSGFNLWGLVGCGHASWQVRQCDDETEHTHPHPRPHAHITPLFSSNIMADPVYARL